MARFCLILFVLCAAAFLTGPAAAQSGVIHEEHSLYRNILVTQNGDELCMLFRARRGLGRESCMYLSRPDVFVFDYAGMMLASLYVNPSPRRVLIIGEGGGTLPTALQQLVPGIEIDVVEIDAAVDRIAREYFNFEPGPNTEIFIQDGRVFVKRAQRNGEKYDLVMLDAFEADYIPEHMLTQEFLEEVKSILTPDGVVAANTFSLSALYDYESVTYRAVFGEFFNLRFANRIVVARNGGLPSMEEVQANVPQWSAELRRRGVNPDRIVPLMSTEVDWDPGVRVLTDQYSPSNVLNAMPRRR